MSEEKATTTTTESPLDRYAAMRDGTMPIAQLAEGTSTTYLAPDGDVYRLNYVVLEYPEKSGAKKHTGAFSLAGEGYDFQPGMMIDTILNAWYAAGRLEVDCWAYRVVASRYVKDAAGRDAKFNFHLSIGTDGVIVTTSEDFAFGKMRWTGKGFNRLEIPSGTLVQMESLAPPDYPTETPTPKGEKPKE